MSKELVERLRKMGNGYAEPMIGDYDEAADEIDRLNGIIEEALEYQEWGMLERSLSKAHKVKE